ncbi:MAG: 30S ribosomal protein S3 [Phycisphaerae bacterium]
MGQKVSPIGFRIGVTEDWRSRWYAPKPAYAEFLSEDLKIRRSVERKLNESAPYPGCAKVEIERTRNEVKLIIHTARPGLVIGPKGAEIDKLKEEIENLIDRKVNVNIVEIKNPDISAPLVAQSIADQLKKRASFRRVMKQKCETALQAGAKGIKIILKGRLGGSEMARVETQKMGSIPLQTLQARVEYGYAVARTTYGTLGCRVWVYLGHYGEVTAAEEGAPAGLVGQRRRRL